MESLYQDEVGAGSSVPDEGEIAARALCSRVGLEVRQVRDALGYLARPVFEEARNVKNEHAPTTAELVDRMVLLVQELERDDSRRFFLTTALAVSEFAVRFNTTKAVADEVLYLSCGVGRIRTWCGTDGCVRFVNTR